MGDTRLRQPLRGLGFLRRLGFESVVIFLQVESNSIIFSPLICHVLSYLALEYTPSLH